MRRFGLVMGGILVFLCAGGRPVWAQRVAETSLRVHAYNQGVFSCALNLSGMALDPVLATGASAGTANDDGAYAAASGAVAWSCRSAPAATLTLALVSTPADHVAGGLWADALEVRVPATAGGTSTGYQAFSSQAPLLTGLRAGHAEAVASGTLDVRLAFRDMDPIGRQLASAGHTDVPLTAPGAEAMEANAWVVRLRVAGNP